MKNKIIVMLLIAILILPSMACTVVPDENTSNTDPMVRQSTLTATVSTLQQSIATKADIGTVASKVDESRVRQIVSESGSGSIFKPGDYYTKNEVDLMLAKLKNDLINSSNNNTSNDDDSDNNCDSANGLTVDFYGQPVTVYNGLNTSYEFPVEIINDSTTSHTIRLKIELEPESSKPNINAAITKFSIDSADVNLTQGTDRIDTVIYPSSGSGCYTIEGTSGEIWIAKRSSTKGATKKLITVKFVLNYVTTQNPVGWNEASLSYKIKD